MTAKTKAEQLIEKYMKGLHDPIDVLKIKTRISAKECALICVENELDALDRFANFWVIQNGEWYKEERKKIEEVKQELQNL